MSRIVRTQVPLVAATVLVVMATLLGVGCKAPAATKAEPTVTPPAIKEAGVLRAGVDLSYPPFGGTDAEKQAGLDIDVASALAAKLGLDVKIENVAPSDAATALASGKVDVVLSVPYSEESLARTSLAGSYISDGPAFFIATEGTASVDPSMTIDTLRAPRVGAQKGSAAYWKLESETGLESVNGYPTLREALNALRTGEVKVVAGDAIVGAYMIRDMPTVHFAGQLEPAVPLGAAVAVDNTRLADAVRGALDALAADGVLSTIRTKWVGALPKLALPLSADTSESPGATATP